MKQFARTWPRSESLGGVITGEETKVQQSFREQCSLKRIIDKFVKTGSIGHLNRKEAQYGDFSRVENLLEATERVDRAWEEFRTLPARVRAAAGHTPQGLEEMLATEDGVQELEDLGISIGYEDIDRDHDLALEARGEADQTERSEDQGAEGDRKPSAEKGDAAT